MRAFVIDNLREFDLCILGRHRDVVFKAILNVTQLVDDFLEDSLKSLISFLLNPVLILPEQVTELLLFFFHRFFRVCH